MPAQAPLLPTYPAVPVIPGVPVLALADVQWNQLVEIKPAGSLSAVLTLQTLFDFFQGGVPATSYRLITSGATVDMTDEDAGILILKTVSSATLVNLPVDPEDGLEVFIKYGKNDQDSNNTTISAGGVILINGLTTLVMTAAWQVVHLKFMAEQWWTI